MDALNVLLDGAEIPASDDGAVESFLMSKLQSKDSYDAYFTSLPLQGSIVEDIAEVQAQLSVLERELRSELVQNKEEVCDSLSNQDIELQLDLILEQIDQLWELENPELPAAEAPDVFASLQMPSNERASKGMDEFQVALQKLKQQARDETGRNSDTKRDNLGLVLTNWNALNELLELPTLASTCIKTGHYQEALLCHSHARSLVYKFPAVSIIRHIADAISHEVRTTMLQGLVKMLQQNISANPMKKILTYLLSIPPFDTNPQALLQVFLTMRYKFVCAEMDSFSITELANETMGELLVKRKIEAFREHVFNAISILQIQSEAFNLKSYEEASISIPLLGEPRKAIHTNPLILMFVETCCDALIASLRSHQSFLSVSVCLQLVYCSFRLADSNSNYHHLFINKIREAELFSSDELIAAMDKRRELANKYY
ncbi:LADA_0H14972g1_1 [Lachancea dasiensis]|uniref:Conserved oligomeric Golgi complex subunit 8 n=1 Tax=Lachancea dasiensis TaxID=1072105 RepID=A0A1G4K4N7_9SACH|nr:LADA_0H14972g1_1 [Lachancea dasiensis]